MSTKTRRDFGNSRPASGISNPNAFLITRRPIGKADRGHFARLRHNSIPASATRPVFSIYYPEFMN
jgi:hypothetical protein